jgi:protein-L-isoaspartate(D-aspartate) O-methyltransferase
LFNGQPGTLTVWIDALGLTAGARVLHVGSGLGYYTAILAQAAGASGRVVAYEVDDTLASEAQHNLAFMPWVEVRHGDASQPLGETFDAILVNAGVTHPLDVWLDAAAPGGRIVVPLTGTMGAMGTHIGKGLVWLLTKQDGGDFAARMIGMAAIYSALGIRDEALNEKLGRAMMAGPAQWQAVTRLRRDEHESSSSCWFHADRCCLSNH